MRISDWSSDVCSSDLIVVGNLDCGRSHALRTKDIRKPMCDNSARSLLQEGYGIVAPSRSNATHHHSEEIALQVPNRDRPIFPDPIAHRQRWYTAIRSEERREGKEWVSTCRSRWSQVHT